MGEGTANPSSAACEEFGRKHRTGLVTLLFTDIVDSTRLKQQLGDQTGATLIQKHHARIRELLVRFPEGEEIETAGDSFLIVFAKPSEAVRFALMVQCEVAISSQAASHTILDRIGIHVGEVVIQENEASAKPKDLYGLQIDTCARVNSLAPGGRILLTRGAFDSARQVLRGEDIEGVGPLSWVSHGPYVLKGIDEPVEICEVSRGTQSIAPPTGSEKARRSVAPENELVLGWRPAVAQLVPGTKWNLESKLGEGGFGEVWLGKHQVLGEKRVFKFCFRAERARSLKREVTLFRLMKERVGQHPNIVGVQEVFFDEPPFYIMMDYAQGKDLKSWCDERGGPRAIREETRLEIVAQVANALQAAHDAGVIHRDVKPANVLVSDGGVRCEEPKLEVKLTDFGIGQVVSQEILAGITRTGFTQTILADSYSSQSGTQMYMAPELFAGKPASIRSDIYSLGVVLYQLLVGDFSRPLATDWNKSILDPLLRADLEHCFAGDPHERFAGAAQLAQNLRSLEQRRQARARQQAEWIAREKAAFRKGVIRTAALALLVLTAMGFLALLAMKTAQDRRRHLYVADINVAYHALQANELGRAKSVLQRYAERRFWEEDLRGFEWRALWNRCQDNFENSFAHEAATCAILSPNGQRLATAGLDRKVRVWEIATGNLLQTLSGFDGIIETKALAFSPDGKRLAAKGGTQIRIWETDTWREAAPILQGEANFNYNNSAVFSPDGLTFVTRGPGGVTFWDTATWKTNGFILPGTNRVAGFSMLGTVLKYSPDARFLAVTDWHQLQLRDGASPDVLIANLLRRDGNSAMRVLSVAFSEKLAAAGYRDGIVTLWELDTWKEIASCKLHPSSVLGLAFTPDGRRLATAGSGHVIQFWEIAALLEQAARNEPFRPAATLKGHLRTVNSVEFSRDGAVVLSASADGTAKLWKAPSSSPRSILRGSVFPLWFSPDGKHLITRQTGGELTLWNVKERRTVGVVGPAKHPGSTKTETISPNGLMYARALEDGSVEIWQIPENTLIHTRSGGHGQIRALKFSPNPHQDLLAIKSDAMEPDVVDVTLWNLRSGAEDRVAPAGSRYFRSTPESWDFSSDGLHLAIANSDYGLTILDTTTRRGRRLEAGAMALNPVAFMPDGKKVAAADTDDPSIWLWDVKTGHRTLAFSLPTESINRIAFTADGRSLVTGDFDNILVFWNLALRKELMTVRNDNPMLTYFFFSPNGDELAIRGPESMNAFGQVELWTAQPLSEIDRQIRHER